MSEISYRKKIDNNEERNYAIVDDNGRLLTSSSLAGGGQIDAFGRMRVSQISTQLDLKQIHDNQPLFWDRALIGTGLSTYVSASSSSSLTTAADGDAVIVQTFQRSNYQSGKSHQLFFTFAGMNAETNITKRVGYFSSNTITPFDSNKDGFWLESSNGVISLVVSKNGSETRVNQTSWNIDKANNTGDLPNIDWSKTQILMVEFEWLGVGGIRFSLVVDMAIYPIHQFNHANNLSSVYMQSPNKPLRYEIRQTGVGSGILSQICVTVGSEGSINSIGRIFSSDLGTSFVNANTIGTIYALMGITLKTASADTSVDIIDFSILTTTSTDLAYKVILNPTVAGVFTYTDVTNSSVQIARGDSVNNPSTNTITGGTLLASGYIKSGSGAFSGGSKDFQIENAIRLGMSIAGVTDKIVVAVQPIQSNADVYCSITWRERT